MRYSSMMRQLLVVVTLGLILLLLSVQPIAAQSCQNPGTGTTTDYAYDSAQNSNVICTILSAQATVNAYTPTPTPTLLPTPAAIATITGCNPYANGSLYQLCVEEDSHTRADTSNGIYLPLVFFAVIIIGWLRGIKA